MSKILFVFTLVVSFSSFSSVASTVSRQPQAECAFGQNLEELDSNSRFNIQKDVIKTFKLNRSSSAHELTMVAVSILTDKQTGRAYHLNATFMDHYDGGNTVGWIEDVTDADNEMGRNADAGKVVALIGDSEIDHCTTVK